MQTLVAEVLQQYFLWVDCSLLLHTLENKMKLNLDLSDDPKFATNLEKQHIHGLGYFIKLPKNFLASAEKKKIEFPKFSELVKEKDGHKWLEERLGAPCYGPLWSSRVDRKRMEKDMEEAWILAGTAIYDINHPKFWRINRGIVKGKFLYSLTDPYIGNEWITPWKLVIPGFIRSKELGWIGWALVTTDGEKRPRENTKWLITWNHHRLVSCSGDLYKKIEKFFKITGIATRWLMGRSSIDSDGERFFIDYESIPE